MGSGTDIASVLERTLATLTPQEFGSYLSQAGKHFSAHDPHACPLAGYLQSRLPVGTHLTVGYQVVTVSPQRLAVATDLLLPPWLQCFVMRYDTDCDSGLPDVAARVSAIFHARHICVLEEQHLGRK